MINFCVRKYIDGDLHELYEIHQTEDVSQFPWLIRYQDHPIPNNHLGPRCNPDNWYWVPLMIQSFKFNPRVSPVNSTRSIHQE